MTQHAQRIIEPPPLTNHNANQQRRTTHLNMGFGRRLCNTHAALNNDSHGQSNNGTGSEVSGRHLGSHESQNRQQGRP